MPAPGRHLTPEDIEYALSLLPEEQKPKRRWIAILQWLVLTLFMITGCIGIYGGLVTVWFERDLAKQFFIVGIGALILFIGIFFIWGLFVGLFKPRTKEITAFGQKAEESVKNTEVGQAATELWDKRSGKRMMLIGFLLFASVPGCVWMTYKLVRYQELWIPALLLLSAPLLSMAVVLAIHMYQEDQYYRSVVGVRGWLETNPEGEMTSKDYAVLSKAEDRLVKQSIQQISKEMTETNWYGVITTPGVQEHLAKLGDDQRYIRYDFREIIDELQFNPTPEDAHATADVADTYTLQRGSYRIIYTVDNSAKRVIIIDLQVEGSGEAENDS